MLNQINIQNFKSIQMVEPIELKRFSIFCGSNSSGKSSLIQAILMLSQSFSSRYHDEPITLNGPLVRLGSFDDIKRHSSKNENIHLSFSLPLNDIFFEGKTEKIVSFSLTIGHRNKLISKSEDEYHPVIISNIISLSAKNTDGEYHETDRIGISLRPVTATKDSAYIVTEFNISGNDRMQVEYPDYEVIGTSKGGLVPTSFNLEYDLTKKISSIIISVLMEGIDKKRTKADLINIPEEYHSLPRIFLEKITILIKNDRQEFLDSLIIPDEFVKNNSHGKNDLVKKNYIADLKEQLVSSMYPLKPNFFPNAFLREKSIRLNDWYMFINNINDREKKSLIELISKNRAELQQVWYENMPNKKGSANYSVNAFFEIENILNFYFSRSLKYLGPLRMEPQAIYSSLGHLDPDSVGLKGEYTAAVLHKNKDKFIEYLSPYLDGNDNFSFRHKRRPFRVACQEWLVYLGVANEFKTEDKGNLGYVLNVKTSQNDKWQDLTHVGVGVSQVLPIVIMSLLSDEKDILIFEQPELHLHPQVQSRLCDLFIAMAESNRQCLIETHSEYMINRLRLRVVQEKCEKIKDNTSLFFIEKNRGTSFFSKVEINKYGTVLNWPKDFFDQIDREIENILYEAAMKKKRERVGVRQNSQEK